MKVVPFTASVSAEQGWVADKFSAGCPAAGTKGHDTGQRGCLHVCLTREQMVQRCRLCKRLQGNLVSGVTQSSGAATDIVPTPALHTLQESSSCLQDIALYKHSWLVGFTPADTSHMQGQTVWYRVQV